MNVMGGGTDLDGKWTDRFHHLSGLKHIVWIWTEGSASFTTMRKVPNAVMTRMEPVSRQVGCILATADNGYLGRVMNFVYLV